MDKNRWITWVEYMDVQGASPFWIVKQVEGQGFSRMESIEIYRQGTLAWSLV